MKCFNYETASHRQDRIYDGKGIFPAVTTSIMPMIAESGDEN